ncbi:cupin domain-containing protein [Halococcoides cellulosivorans]|uniref:Cupin domain-containing protein n=1 Tax=Halococcoides cellulosivorans TaxID=1679096 RepID=A0A2R4X0L0_9EURY|nr:cupin domain-containing protein [Halococcoides cellulosivorans]AWB27316.1 cupin domain-containing protein [Halococcoides cellulosivorans]
MTDAVDDIAGEVLALDDLIDYQDGAVVSRTLIDRESATLTVFAFDVGERLSEHTAPHEALVQVLDGTVTITLDGDEHDLVAGESMLMPAEVPHAVDATERTKLLITMVR